MCNFVVCEKRVVDGRNSAKHVRDQHEETGFLHHGRGAGSDDRVLEMTIDSRLLVAPYLLPSLVSLTHNVTHEERERTGEAVRIAVIRDVTSRRIPFAVTHRAVR